MLFVRSMILHSSASLLIIQTTGMSTTSASFADNISQTPLKPYLSSNLVASKSSEDLRPHYEQKRGPFCRWTGVQLGSSLWCLQPRFHERWQNECVYFQQSTSSSMKRSHQNIFQFHLEFKGSSVVKLSFFITFFQSGWTKIRSLGNSSWQTNVQVHTIKTFCWWHRRWWN